MSKVPKYRFKIQISQPYTRRPEGSRNPFLCTKTRYTLRFKTSQPYIIQHTTLVQRMHAPTHFAAKHYGFSARQKEKEKEREKMNLSHAQTRSPSLPVWPCRFHFSQVNSTQTAARTDWHSHTYITFSARINWQAHLAYQK